jgi:hypothetical protein
VTPRRVPLSRFTPDTLGDPKPRTIVLADVAELSTAQADAVGRYLNDGGAALVLLGPRVVADRFNETLYRGGKGWLPCRLEEIVTAPDDELATLDASRLLHPALAVFESRGKNKLAELSFRRWWRVATERHGGIGVPALLSNGNPWLVEKSVGEGRVLVSTVPFDRSWDNLLTSAWEFPVLVHELLFSLTDLGSQRYNLAPGQPIRVGPDVFVPPWRPATLPVPGVLHGPTSSQRPLLLANWPGLLEPPGPAGVYRVELGDRPSFPIVVHDEAREADLTPLSSDDRKRLAELADIRWESAAAASDATLDLWRACFVGLIVLLLAESWLARGMQRV